MVATVCSKCGATKPADAPTAAQGGWDSAVLWGMRSEGLANTITTELAHTCSRECRAALGLRERYRVFSRDPIGGGT